MENVDAYPLQWPLGYKRTSERTKSLFKQTMDASQKFLRAELDRLKAQDIVVSSNIPVRKDGGMYSDYMNRRIADPGVAVYFTLKGKPLVMCCDRYESVWENVYAIGKGIEAMRGMDRWGISDFIERAFTGFAALPASTEDWYHVLGVAADAKHDDVVAAHRKLVKIHHPDKGGDPVQFDRVTRAFRAYLGYKV